MRYLAEPKHKHGALPKAAILLVNLGTPEAPTASAVKPYLRQFLSDPRVVEIARPVWWLILHLFVLTTRPRRSAEKYAKIWTRDGSPLKIHTENQAKLLRGYLGSRIKSPHVVGWAMRYGEPSIGAALRDFRSQACDRLLVIPLYPQYSAASTASVFDAVGNELRQTRNAPALRTVKQFHDHPAYIAAAAKQISDYWMMHNRPDQLVFSFHGVPRYTLDKGDPYHCQCQKTARLIANELGIKEQGWTVSFQSRFGRARWLQPYTIDVVTQLARKKTGRIDVFCPGFVADCLETLEEIAIENKAAFLRAGGREFHHIPCLNERYEWIEALARIAADNLHGWAATEFDLAGAQRAAELGRERALSLGAKD
jgi:protoporphyrin/coproporphyrin ferrochelatase